MENLSLSLKIKIKNKMIMMLKLKLSTKNNLITKELMIKNMIRNLIISLQWKQGNIIKKMAQFMNLRMFTKKESRKYLLCKYFKNVVNFDFLFKKQYNMKG